MDECSGEYPNTGLLSAKTSINIGMEIGRWFRRENLKVAVHSGIGYSGLHAGPGVHFLDPLALADPLLARLPYVPEWRLVPGHFKRHIPIGYFDSLPDHENQIADPALREYYGQLRTITRGEIWDRARLRTIVAFNLGRFDYLRKQYLDSPSAAPVHFTMSDLDPAGRQLPEQVNPRARVVMVTAARIIHPRQFTLGLDRDASFELVLYLGQQQVFTLRLPDNAPDYGRPMIIPEEVAKTGIDRFIIYKLGDDRQYKARLDSCWMAE
jgi:hypothetical protein